MWCSTLFTSTASCYLVLNMLWNSQPVEADWYISDVIQWCSHCGCGGCLDTSKIQVGVFDTLEILVSLVTCNWSLSSAKVYRGAHSITLMQQANYQPQNVAVTVRIERRIQVVHGIKLLLADAKIVIIWLELWLSFVAFCSFVGPQNCQNVTVHYVMLQQIRFNQTCSKIL